VWSGGEVGCDECGVVVRLMSVGYTFPVVVVFVLEPATNEVIGRRSSWKRSGWGSRNTILRDGCIKWVGMCNEKIVFMHLYVCVCVFVHRPSAFWQDLVSSPTWCSFPDFSVPGDGCGCHDDSGDGAGMGKGNDEGVEGSPSSPSPSPSIIIIAITIIDL